MASGTSGAMSTSNTYVKYTISITENSTSIANNTSNVTVNVRFYRTNSGYSTYGTGTVYCAINGTTYSASVTPSQKITNSGIILFSKTLDIGHDSDGSKTLNTAAYISHDAPLTSSSQSYSLALSTIPRTSGLTVGDGLLGTAQTITADRKSSSFTHTLTWASGSYSGTIADKSSATSWSFTPEMKLANGAPYGNDVYCEFTLATYSGSTWVGSVTKAVYLHIPESVKPTCTTVTISDANGYATTYGGYIQGQSKLTISLAGVGSYGSSVAAYWTSVNGDVYLGSPFTTNVLTTSGSVQIDAYVFDTRNRYSDVNTKYITVLPYSKPSAQFSIRRCDEDGTENERGSYAQVRMNYSITSLSNQNTKSVTLYYKKTEEETWTTVTITATNYAESDLTAIFPADDAHTYNVKLTVTDAFASTTATANLSTGYCLYHIPASGKGITFGGVAEKDGFNVKMDAHFINGVTEDIKILYEGDCDELITSGNYYIGNNGSNKPPDGMNGWLTVKSYGTNTCCQTYTTYQGKQYNRFKIDGTWSSWTHPDIGGKILWSGGLHMNGNQTIQLSESIKSQPNGIVLIFGPYRNNVLGSDSYNHEFVSKYSVMAYDGIGCVFRLSSDNFNEMGTKYLYMHDSSIGGHVNNTTSGTSNGITFNNSLWVLLYVIGV